MRNLTRLVCLSALAVGLLISGCGGSGDDANNEVLIVVGGAGLSLRLLSTDTFSLGPDLAITGLQASEVIEAIDVRPGNGVLYGFSNQGRLYTLDIDTGVATQVGVQFALTGAVADIDFNPTVDRLRIVTVDGENIRVDPDTGITVGTDTNLSYAVGDVNNGNAINLAGMAYTNSIAGSATTVLYGLDAIQNTLVSIPSPNSGQVTTIAATSSSIGGAVGMDISGQTSFAYALNNSNQVVRVNTATGLLIDQVTLPIAINDLAVLE